MKCVKCNRITFMFSLGFKGRTECDVYCPLCGYYQDIKKEAEGR